MSLLEDLYRGKIVPSEKSIKNGSEYQKLNEQLAEYLSEFSPLLDDKQRELFRKIYECNFELNDIEDVESFIRGFRIGIQLMLEAMNYKSENFY